MVAGNYSEALYQLQNWGTLNEGYNARAARDAGQLQQAISSGSMPKP